MIYKDCTKTALKKMCKERCIKGYSRMDKEELVSALTEFDTDQAETESAIEVALMNGTKFYKIIRGWATHIDYCPIVAREYKGKPYANFIDDCLGCGYLLALSQNMGNYNHPEQFILCGARNEYISTGKMGQSLRIPFDYVSYFNKCQTEKKLYELTKVCPQCQWIGNVDSNEDLCPTCDEHLTVATTVENVNSVITLKNEIK